MIKNNISENSKIGRLFDDIILNKSDTSKMTIKQIEEYFSRILKIIANAFVNPELQELKLSLAIDAGKDIDYIEFYHNIVEPHIEKIKLIQDVINNMIPNESRINNAEHKTTIETFINEALPSEMQEQLTVIESLSNFGKYFNKEMSNTFIHQDYDDNNKNYE